jgi:hypothetical protein
MAWVLGLLAVSSNIVECPQVACDTLKTMRFCKAETWTSTHPVISHVISHADHVGLQTAHFDLDLTCVGASTDNDLHLGFV